MDPYLSRTDIYHVVSLARVRARRHGSTRQARSAAVIYA